MLPCDPDALIQYRPSHSFYTEKSTQTASLFFVTRGHFKCHQTITCSTAPDHKQNNNQAQMEEVEQVALVTLSSKKF